MGVKTEVILKTVVIVLMAFMLVMLFSTIILMAQGYIEENTFFIHYLAGSLLFLLIPIHLSLRFGKLRKLLREFVSILQGGDPKMSATKDKLLSTFEDKTLKEFALMFDLNLTEVEFIFDMYGYKVSKDLTLKEIVTNKDELFKTFTKIIHQLKN